MGCVYALIATGLTLVFGVLRIVNIAHGETVVIGMYTGYWCFELLQLPLFATIPIAGIVLFVFGVGVQRLLIQPVMDRPIHVQFLLFIGLAFAITGLQAMMFSPTGRSIMSADSFSVYQLFGLRLDAIKAHSGVVALILMASLACWLRFSLLGMAIRACAANPTGAVAIGIPIRRIYSVTAGLGAACAGVAGALIAPAFDTTPFLGQDFTLLAFVVVVVGGLGSFPGALLGGVLIGVTESLAAFLVEPVTKSLFSYGALILVLLLRPYGILGKRGLV